MCYIQYTIFITFNKMLPNVIVKCRGHRELLRVNIIFILNNLYSSVPMHI